MDLLAYTQYIWVIKRLSNVFYQAYKQWVWTIKTESNGFY